MTKILIIGIVALVVLLVGASAVMAQDSGTGPVGRAVCPIGTTGGGQTADGQPVGPGMMGGANRDEMIQAMGEAMQNGDIQQMHDSMGQYVPEEMRGMHDAMGQVMQSGDPQQMYDTCQSYIGGQQGDTQGNTETTPDNPPATTGARGPGSMMGGSGTGTPTGGSPMMGGGTGSTTGGPGSMMGGRRA